jgi:proteic killer suppression protein
VIKSFRHKGIEQFFETGSRRGTQYKQAERLRKQLFALDNAKSAKDMNAPGWRLHALHGDLEGHWSVDVSGNWRLTFTFEGENAVLVDYHDYHLRRSICACTIHRIPEAYCGTIWAASP